MKKSYQVEYNLVTMNIIGFIYTAVLVILTIVLLKTTLGSNFPDSLGDNFNKTICIITLLYIFWICLHEFIHGIFYCIGGTKWSNISFGAALEKGILYCKCRSLITIKNAMISLLAPLIIIGIITYVISFIIGSYTLLFLSIANIYGACGDIVVFLFFTKLPKDTRFKEIGDTSTFMLQTKEDLTKLKFPGIKKISLIEDLSKFEETDIKKIKISKQSIYYFLILLFIMILGIIIAQ